MTDILWRKTTYPDDGSPRYLYRPVSPAGCARFKMGKKGCCLYSSDDDGWFGFGDWAPDDPHLALAHDGLVLTEDVP